MKWYNFETMFRSLKDELVNFLKTHSIKYELSGCGAGWHFEILLDSEGAGMVNAFLDSVTV